MARELHTADEIVAEVKRLFDPQGVVRHRVPKPVFIARPEPGACNWGMALLKTRDRGIQHSFIVALQDVRSRWDLKV